MGWRHWRRSGTLSCLLRLTGQQTFYLEEMMVSY